MATSLMEMLAAANAVVPRISPEQANDMIAKGNVLVVDVRDAPELEASGKVKGADSQQVYVQCFPAGYCQ